MPRSTLELAVGGVPFPHGDPDGSWRYRHAVRPEGPTALDAQAVADFSAYERANGRTVIVTADQALADWETWTPPAERVVPGAFPIQCCTHVYPDGCGSRLVSHGAPPPAAVRIIDSGALLSASEATGRPTAELAARSTWGEPPDYFDYVMFANGRCTAPEAVATSRVLGRDLVPAVLEAGYRPAVRFYFDWMALTRLMDATFDGVHPIKIHRSVRLADTLCAVVIHEDEEAVIATVRTSRLADRLVVLGHDRPRPDEWASAADESAQAILN